MFFFQKYNKVVRQRQKFIYLKEEFLPQKEIKFSILPYGGTINHNTKKNYYNGNITPQLKKMNKTNHRLVIRS